MKAIQTISVLLAFSISCATFSAAAEDPWLAPSDAISQKNPIATSEESLSAGKVVYQKRCEGCHGESGKGDGPDSSDLSKKPSSFADKDLNEETDGALFWKIRTGRKPMPKYAAKLSEEDTWNVINFVRTFASKG